MTVDGYLPAEDALWTLAHQDHSKLSQSSGVYPGKEELSVVADCNRLKGVIENRGYTFAESEGLVASNASADIGKVTDVLDDGEGPMESAEVLEKSAVSAMADDTPEVEGLEEPGE